MTPNQRFEDKYIPVTESGCWIWIGAINPGGYGQFSLSNKRVLAHRFSYIRDKGKIPDGLEIDHLCNMRSCVNPDHLEAVTHKENIARSVKEIICCPQGHSYTGDNLYIRNNRKSKECNICREQSRIKYRLKRS